MAVQDIPADPIIPEESSYYVSSGPMAPASGLQGALSGPWMLESQDLNVAYTRVPVGSFNAYPNLTLSGCSAIDQYPTWSHSYTRLNCTIKASYSKVKSYDTYSNSSYQQSQKFTIYAVSSDAQGNTYGNLNASCLGPRGTIVTTQPYLSRRGWVDSIDSEITSSIDVANCSLIISSCGSLGSYNQTFGWASQFVVNYISPVDTATLLHGEASFVEGYYPNYQIPGTYTTQKETLGQVLSFITTIGATIKAEGFAAIPAVWGTNSAGAPTILRDQGLNLYSQWRHDYS